MTKVKYEDADHLTLICQLGCLTIRNLIKLDLGIFMYKSQNKLLPETAGDFHGDFHVPTDTAVVKLLNVVRNKKIGNYFIA